MNSKSREGSASKYKGVVFIKKNPLRPWLARLCINGKQIRGGYYATQEEAALAYNTLAAKHFGEFHRPNLVA